MVEPTEPVEEVEGDFLMGEPVLEEEGGGGGKSARELSGGGGGNSGDCGATPPPSCHFGLALTAGGDWGAGNLEPSVGLDRGREEGEELPGNWLTICLTREEVATDMEEAGGERGSDLEERLCCLGRVGGG